MCKNHAVNQYIIITYSLISTSPLLEYYVTFAYIYIAAFKRLFDNAEKFHKLDNYIEQYKHTGERQFTVTAIHYHKLYVFTEVTTKLP